MLLEKKVTPKQNTACYGMVYNHTEERYSSSTECYERAAKLRKDENVVFVSDGFSWPNSCYIVRFGYKA